MTLKIERVLDESGALIRLSGNLRFDCLDQVMAEINLGETIALDLNEVNLVDVEAVRFLNAREDEGISVLHCSPYIRTWMVREREEERARNGWR
jgi:hypothetical protein